MSTNIKSLTSSKMTLIWFLSTFFWKKKKNTFMNGGYVHVVNVCMYEEWLFLSKKIAEFLEKSSINIDILPVFSDLREGQLIIDAVWTFWRCRFDDSDGEPAADFPVWRQKKYRNCACISLPPYWSPGFWFDVFPPPPPQDFPPRLVRFEEADSDVGSAETETVTRSQAFSLYGDLIACPSLLTPSDEKQLSWLLFLWFSSPYVFSNV